jgi:very-short-patch-repair endonuclease
MTDRAPPRVRGTLPNVEEGARQRRKDMTPSEKRLWAQLRARRLGGYKFRRQHALGRFIVDFCCTKAKLVIEVDGPIHSDRKEYDAERTHVLQTYGYCVLRFSNQQVDDDSDSVLESILATLKEGELR